MERRRGPSRQDAFTLIEIMAVVIIIGLLTTIVGAAIFQQVDKGRVTTAKAQISSLEGVLELYRMDNGRFPNSEQGLEALVKAPSSEPSPRNYPPGGYLKGGIIVSLSAILSHLPMATGMLANCETEGHISLILQRQLPGHILGGDCHQSSSCPFRHGAGLPKPADRGNSILNRTNYVSPLEVLNGEFWHFYP